MNNVKLTYVKVKLPEPKWNSELAEKIVELEKIRGMTPNPASLDVFMMLKIIFQNLENWASARIEGNQTRILDALDPKRQERKKDDYHIQELNNLEKAAVYIDECAERSTTHRSITKNFILDLHKSVTEGLPVGDDLPGDETPGRYRTKAVEITKSKHVPPMGVKVDDYMNELIEFINHDDGKINHLLKVAIFHHRFTWIHPFNNGNGRVVRLLTYALLDMMGYGVRNGRILNPTAVFFADRQRYYKKLAGADSGTDAGILRWADYFIDGVLHEIQKIDMLLDNQFLKDELLIPVLREAVNAKRISGDQFQVLRASFNSPDMTFAARDLDGALGRQFTPQERSRFIKKMKQDSIIRNAFGKTQRYVIELWSDTFIRFVVTRLRDNGFVTEKL
ncbi:MAG: Fic family protein [Acidobacteriota bacterium]